jgi:predicted nuclease with TOPRIM domain
VLLLVGALALLPSRSLVAQQNLEESRRRLEEVRREREKLQQERDRLQGRVHDLNRSRPARRQRQNNNES